ncbi:hypothetical protein [Faecalicoccus pleomorphus]|uniref:hypothetical protein n=1 Tax=Faecalicoccus pleomorphus TaxID=1323 RepID=UPI00242F216F|nr:hypothetical protein [Faecalicoccus pleomorphus]
MGAGNDPGNAFKGQNNRKTISLFSKMFSHKNSTTENGLNKALFRDWERFFMCKNLVIFHLFSDQKWLFFVFLHRFSNAEIKFLYSNLWFYAASDAVLLKNKTKVPGGLEVSTYKPRFASGQKIPTSKPPGTFRQKTGQNVFTEAKNEPKLTDFWS